MEKLTVKQCARLLHRDVVSIYVAIYEKRLKAHKINKRWFIPKTEIKRLEGKSQIRKDSRIKEVGKGKCQKHGKN